LICNLKLQCIIDRRFARGRPTSVKKKDACDQLLWGIMLNRHTGPISIIVSCDSPRIKPTF
jgi:hypothetical protein